MVLPVMAYLSILGAQADRDRRVQLSWELDA